MGMERFGGGAGREESEWVDGAVGLQTLRLPSLGFVCALNNSKNATITLLTLIIWFVEMMRS